MSTDRTFFAIGAVTASIGVAAGAFGAHALKHQITADSYALYQTAFQYQMYSAFGLLIVGLAASRWPGAKLRAAGWLFVVGMLIFCGTVYALSLSSPRWLGAITPIGGLCLIIGWALLAWAAIGDKTASSF